MSNVKANRTHSQHCDFKSQLIRLLRLGSGAAALFPDVVRLRVECGHLSRRAGRGPTPGDLWPAVAKAVAQTRCFICSHAVGNSGDDYIPARCLLIILNE